MFLIKRIRPIFQHNRKLLNLIARTSSKMSKISYPSVRRDVDFSEKIHGVDVKDPYRWLENNDDEEVKQFCKEQQDLTMSYMQDAPNRAEIRENITDLFNYPKFGCPFKRGENYFMFKNSGLQNQSVMYKFNSLHAEHELFLDPNTFSEDGSSALGKWSFSKDSKWMAYAISKGGSDWLTIHIRNVDTKEDLPDKLEHCKYTNISWTHDNLGFFYSKYEREGDVLQKIDATENHKVYYHRINTPQSNDVFIFDTPEEPKNKHSCEVSDCGKLVFFSIGPECANNLWYYAKLDENSPFQKRFVTYPIIDKLDAEYDYVTNDDNLIYFKTNKNASNFRICRIDLSQADAGNVENFVDIVPTDDKAVLEEAMCVNDNKLAIIYLKDVINEIEIHNLEDGKLLRKLDIPIGTIASISAKRDHHELFFNVTSFLSPGLIYHYDFKNVDEKDLNVFMEIKVKGFDEKDYVTKQVFFESNDGQVRIPMFITHRRDIAIDSSNPCLMFGYGGFKISLQPYFSVSRLFFMKHFKGVYALANIRGGNEYGSSWHDAGRLLNKQNCFDDFQQAAEYLIENGYTCKEKLVIEGGSNGGLLVGACANQRPDLFGAVICHVGVMDLIRYDKFTCGSAWSSDYGSSTDAEKGSLYFKNHLKLSPLHNVPYDCPKYPAFLILTSDHDDRVVPLHSFKFAAELQYAVGRKSSNPALLRVEMKAGHGAGKSTEKALAEVVDIYCFIQKALDLKYYD